MTDSFVPAAVSIVIIQPAFYASHKLPHYFTLKLTASTESLQPRLIRERGMLLYSRFKVSLGSAVTSG